MKLMYIISRPLLCLLLSSFILIQVHAQGAMQKAEKTERALPDPRDVVLYQVNIRAFSEEGNFQGVINRLDSIQAMGANVIYLMPTYNVGTFKAINSPYCIQDYRSVNPEFGSLKELQNLVKEAHHRGMAVLMDWVANHTSYDHVWIPNKEWYLTDSTGQIMSPPGTGWNDVAQLNFSNEDMKSEMIASMQYWIDAVDIDGFRCDYSDGPPYEFWKAALDSLRTNNAQKLIMMSEGRRSDHYTAGFDYNFGFGFFGQLKHVYTHGASASKLNRYNTDSYQEASDRQRMIRYTSNHDVNGSDGTSLELFGGMKGSLGAFIVSAYMKSVPMLYGGQEVGLPYRLEFPFDTKNIDWTLNPALKSAYKSIIKFYHESEAIRRGDLELFSSQDVVCFTKTIDNEQVLVLVNVRNNELNFELPNSLAQNGWHDAYTKNDVALQSEVILEPYDYWVLRRID